jgi:hypothetical protein
MMGLQVPRFAGTLLSFAHSSSDSSVKKSLLIYLGTVSVETAYIEITESKALKRMRKETAMHYLKNDPDFSLLFAGKLRKSQDSRF